MKIFKSTLICLDCAHTVTETMSTDVDLVNKLETETKLGRAGRIADALTRVDLLVLDELGYLPFAQSGGQLLFHLISRL